MFMSFETQSLAVVHSLVVLDSLESYVCLSVLSNRQTIIINTYLYSRTIQSNNTERNGKKLAGRQVVLNDRTDSDQRLAFLAC